MALWNKAKNWLEWAQLAKFVADLLVSAASWKVVKTMLGHVPQVSTDWASALSLFSAGIVLWLIVWWQQQYGRKSGQQGTGLVQANSKTGLTAPPSDVWDYKDFFRLAYISPMQADIEQRISTAANAAQPNNREAFLLKVIGIGAIAYTYDTIWWSIYGSQLLFLLDLNRHHGMLPVNKAREYYDKAKNDFPQVYSTYSFDGWVTYMVSQLLIIRYASDMIEITHRGKDFLKYLLHWGKEADAKTF